MQLFMSMNIFSVIIKKTADKVLDKICNLDFKS